MIAGSVFGTRQTPPEQLPSASKMPARNAHRAADVLPSAAGEEAMVAARDQLRAVFERDPERRLERGPVRAHLGRDVLAMDAGADRPVDLVSHAKIGNRTGAAVRQQ